MIKTLISVVMLVVVASFTSCNQQGTQPAQTATQTTKSSVVYVNIDSLVNNYTMYKDLNAEFIQKAQKVQTDLEKKGNAFQAKLQTFEKQVKNSLITRTEAMTKEQNLQKEQQELLQYRDQILQKIAEDEQVLRNKIIFSIKEFIKKYNETKKYDLIITTSEASGTVVASNPSLDITNDIILGINAEYIPEKK